MLLEIQVRILQLSVRTILKFAIPYTINVVHKFKCMVVMNALPTVSVNTSGSTICYGSSTSLTAAGGTSYNWSTGEKTSSITVSPVITTNYDVTVTNASGCTNTERVTVTVNSLPVPNAGFDQTICQGQSALLTAIGGTSYQWSNGATSSSINVSPSNNTTYTVTATSNGCTAADDVVVNVNSLPSVNAGPDQTICQGQSITLASGKSYHGALGHRFICNCSPTSTTSYSVTATSVSGCTAVDNVTINVNPLCGFAGTDQNYLRRAVLTLCSGGSSYL